VPMLIKTSLRAYSRLEQEILAHHPYELPEIVGVCPTTGLPRYLDWLATESLAE